MSSSFAFFKVPQATYVVAQGPGNPASKPGVPMYIAQPAPPTGYGQAPPSGYTQAHDQGLASQPYGVNTPQVPTGPPPSNVQYAPASGTMQERTEMPPMYQEEPTTPPDGTK